MSDRFSCPRCGRSAPPYEAVCLACGTTRATTSPASGTNPVGHDGAPTAAARASPSGRPRLTPRAASYPEGACSRCGSTRLRRGRLGWDLESGLIRKPRLFVECLDCTHRAKVKVAPPQERDQPQPRRRAVGS